MYSIYASKLYRASKRKDKINAAIQTNLELVSQLAESLDEEFRTPENLGLEPKPDLQEKEKTSAEFDDFVVDEEFDPKSDLMTMDDFKSSPSPSSHDSAPSHNEDSSSSEPEHSPSESDVSELIPESPANEKEPAEASTKIMSSTIADLNVLRGSLNGREDTAGVSRIAEKENEIWIYYEDSVNLNNIMTDVIEFLMASGYDYYEFNRLARTDNAIVFIKLRETVNYPEKQIEDEVDK